MDICCFCQGIKDKETILSTNILAPRETVSFVSWLEDSQCSMRCRRGQHSGSIRLGFEVHILTTRESKVQVVVSLGSK